MYNKLCSFSKDAAVGDDTKDPSEWWLGGFPEQELATVKQKQFLQRRMHLILEILQQYEAVALRHMGEERWLEAVAKSRANSLITQLKILEDEEKGRVIAEQIAKGGASNCVSSEDICSCGGLLNDGGIMRSCRSCGKVSFHVKL